jgi:hypothetical protein
LFVFFFTNKKENSTVTTLAIIETQNIALDVFIVVQKYPSDDGVTRYK